MAAPSSTPSRVDEFGTAKDSSNLPPSSSSVASTETNLGSEETSRPQPIQDDPVVETDSSNDVDVSVHQQPSPPQEAQQADQVVLQPAFAVPPPEEAVQGPAAAAPPRVYTCMSCGKSYPTPHALGGHVVVHKKKQNQAEAVAAGAAHQAEGNVIPMVARAREVSRKKHYQCNLCGRVFPTRMALGGHMRKHYKGSPTTVHRNSMEPCVAPPPPVAPPALVAPPAVGSVADDLTRVLQIITEQLPSHPSVAAGRLHLFGVDIVAVAETPMVQEGTVAIRPHEEAPLEGSSAMTEVSASVTSGQLQDERVQKSSADSPSKESSN